MQVIDATATVGIVDDRVAMNADGDVSIYLKTPEHQPLSAAETHATLRVVGDDYRRWNSTRTLSKQSRTHSRPRRRGTKMTDAEEPPESVRWVGDDHGVLELEMTRPFIEWMELEAEQNDFESVADWVQTQLWVQLTEDLMEKHGFQADVEVEVPHDYARRVALWRADREVEDDLELADVEAFLFNHMQFQPTWTLDGEPWELAEEDIQDARRDSE